MSCVLICVVCVDMCCVLTCVLCHATRAHSRPADLTTNRMHESLQLFDEMVNCAWFANTPVILFLNKADLLKRKLERGIYPSKLFSEYKSGGNFDEAVAFLQRKFLSLSKRSKDKEIHAFVTCATDEKNVRTIFALCKGIILKDVLDEAF